MLWSTDEPRFKVGDVVKLRGCSGKQRVTHVDARNDTISTKYLRSANNYYDRRAIDFELVEQPKPRKAQEDKIMTKLFKVTATNKIGTFLTEDGDGKFVLQMIEGGYEAFDKKDLEKVCPYTIQIDFAAGGGGHFKVPKDCGLQEDEVVIIGRNFGVVKKLDTQNENAQEVINLRRIMTETIGEPVTEAA
ncbi:hypothetical protein N9Y00_07045 [Tateyamaria sp.]|nr:hypothetical protein [Tateyamaria sp.]